MAECVICKKEKPADGFYMRKQRGRTYPRRDCKECMQVRFRARYARNRESVRLEGIEYRAQNKERLSKSQSERRNNDAFRAWKSAYSKKNRTKITAQLRNRRHNDLNYRIRTRLSTYLRQAVKCAGTSKYKTTMNLLGCSIQEFRIYLESKFESGMSWENYGLVTGWEMDHILPSAIFDLTKPDHQKRCFHFSNIQPLWAIENRKKQDKIPNGQPLCL